MVSGYLEEQKPVFFFLEGEVGVARSHLDDLRCASHLIETRLNLAMRERDASPSHFADIRQNLSSAIRRLDEQVAGLELLARS